MSESSLECVRCGALLKKQVIGSNEIYYCRKCGSTSSAVSMSVPAKSANKQINVELIPNIELTPKLKIVSLNLVL